MLVSVEKLASAMDIDPRRVQQLHAQEKMPKEARGKYDLGKCMAWYIRYLHRKMKERASAGPDGEIRSLGEHERRLMSARASLKELELSTRRRELIVIADVEKHMTDLVITTKARILAVPARVAGELVGETSRVMAQAKVEKALKEALAQLHASYSPNSR